MGVMDKFLNVMKLNDIEDEFDGDDYYDDEPTYDDDGDPQWKWHCNIESEDSVFPGYGSSKKIAKKDAALCAIGLICGLYTKHIKY